MPTGGYEIQSNAFSIVSLVIISCCLTNRHCFSLFLLSFRSSLPYYMLKFSSSFAWSRRYCAISTILVSTNPCCRQNRFNSGSLAISVGCSSETISHKMPAGPRPANTERSTAASVCPSRVNTPPSLDRSGKMCPGREKSVGLEFGSANKFTVLARSVALIPVVMPNRKRRRMRNGTTSATLKKLFRRTMFLGCIDSYGKRGTLGVFIIHEHRW